MDEMDLEFWLRGEGGGMTMDIYIYIWGERA